MVTEGTVKEAQNQLAALYGFDSYEDFINSFRPDQTPEGNNDGSTDGNGGPCKGNAVKFLRDKGEKVLDTQTNSCKILDSAQPKRMDGS